MTLASPLERHIQAQLVQYLTLRGWFCWQMQLGSQHGGSVWCTQGIPDLYVFRPGGRALWLEVKRPKVGRISPSQTTRHEELRLSGLPVFVVTSIEDVQAALDGQK